MALAQRWTSEKNRGKTLAFVDIGSALGIVVTSTAIPLIVVDSWRTGWMTLGAMAFAAAILNFFVIRKPPEKAPLPLSSNTGESFGGSIGEIYKKILGDYKFWLIGLAYLLTGFSILVQFTFLSTYAVQELGYPYLSATRLMLVIGIGAIVGKITLGSLSDKVGRIRVMILCAALITAGNLGTAFGQGISLMIFLAVFSLGYGAAWAMYAASAADYFTREYSGSIVGLWTVYMGIGSVLSPIVAGWIADITGTLTWSFVGAASGGGLSLLLLLPLWNLSSNGLSRK
jgi:MFS family permease